MLSMHGTKGARPFATTMSPHLWWCSCKSPTHVGCGHSYGDSSRHGGHAPEQSVLTHRGSEYVCELRGCLPYLCHQ
jgi:hypothetical protein